MIGKSFWFHSFVPGRCWLNTKGSGNQTSVESDWMCLNRDAIWIFFTDFGDQQCAHASAGATTKGVAKLEALQTWDWKSVYAQKTYKSIASPWLHNILKLLSNLSIPCKSSIKQVTIASLSFLTDNVKYRVDQLSTFGVVALHNTAVQHPEVTFLKLGAFYPPKKCVGKRTSVPFWMVLVAPF